MSKVSEQIRQYISCPDFGDKSFGIWGALTKQQRELIKRLCDTCNIFEASTDESQKQLAELKAENERLKEKTLSEREWQNYCAYKIIEPQIKGCLDREREYQQQLK